jgi:recombination protein RecR
MHNKFPQPIIKLIAFLKKLPGVGTKTAERFSFEILNWNQELIKELSEHLQDLKSQIPPCKTCGCLTNAGDCLFCKNRDPESLCIVASAKDVYAIEETNSFKGMYHVINHLLSPLDGRNINSINIDIILQRIQLNNTKEIIIAFDSTLEADATALYLKKVLSRPDLSISRLAFGIPVGSSLEYIDGGTLTRAFIGRQELH